MFITARRAPTSIVTPKANSNTSPAEPLSNSALRAAANAPGQGCPALRTAGQRTAAKLLAKLRPFKWRRDQQFIISADNSDRVVCHGAKADRNHLNIPSANFFTMEGLPSDALARLDLNSRLTLHGHGDTGAFLIKDGERAQHLSPQALARKLQSGGLKQVGVLKLKACNVGNGNYLKELVQELTKLDIQVGYVSGPTGSYSDDRVPMKIGGRRFNFRLPILTATTVSIVIPEKFGLKTIKGNTHVAFPGTRYNLPP